MSGTPALVTPMRRLLRTGGLSAAVFVPAAALIGLGLAGKEGMWGGALGSLIPVAFLGVTAVVALGTARLPATTMGVVVLSSWLLKIVVLLGVLFALKDSAFYDRTMFGLALLVGTIGALALEAAVVLKAKVPYVDPSATNSSAPRQ